MDVVIIANFCMDFSETDNGRFRYLANLLVQNHDVEIITSSFYHINKSQRETVFKHPYKITLIDEPGYKQNICLKRFYSHYVWGKNVKRYLMKRKMPDVVYCAVPSLTGPLEAAKYCEKNNVKFIIDVQDLWPEAFQMVFRLPIVSNIIFAPFKWMANGIYKRADEVVAVSQTYVDHVLSVNERCKKGHAVFLGTDLKTFDENFKRDTILKKAEGEIWLGYCGTLGKSYDLKCVIDAIAILNRSDIKLVIIGDGPQHDEFESYASQKKINSIFIGRVAYDTMCSLLKECDIMVNPIIGTSVASIINKHADYVSSGRPVINTQISPEYRRLIDEYEMGYSVPNGNSVEFARILEKLVNNEDLRTKMGINARKCAVEKFDRKNTYGTIVKCIEN